MPRAARRQSETGIMHVMLRGINREVIFREPEDYERFEFILRQCKSICRYELFAWCLMDNHVHLLIRAGTESIAQVIKRIGCRYVYWYNKKYDRIGHLFQDRYRSEAVETDAYFLTVLRYIMQNSLKAGLEQRMGEYPHSSFAAYSGHPDGMTDTEFARGYISDERELLTYLMAANDEKALDIAPNASAVSDAMVAAWIHKISGCPDSDAFGLLDRETQRACARKVRQRGASIRQIAAATGIPKSNISRMLK